MKYLDFDLAIEPAADGYSARVFHSPGGQAVASFVLPFSDLELENFLLRVGRTRQAVRRRVESSELAAAKNFGGVLFDGLFGGDVRACLRSSLEEARRQDSGLRVRLHLSKAPELADLPWEYLYNRSLNRFLSLSVETPVVRYLDFAESIRPITVEPPLRILLMISSPTDHTQLDVTREVTKMNEALRDLQQRGLVYVEHQENASLAELQRRLRTGEFHIFHFVGHGGFDRAAQNGYLLLEDGNDRSREVGAQYIGAVLHDHRPLRLAVLNACEGARGSVTDPFAGTAQSLVQQGIPAVIAMQFEVSDEAAICFTHEFYAALAGGYPVDAALAEARKAIFAQVSETEWGTPVLYMRSPDGRIFDVQPTAAPARASAVVEVPPARPAPLRHVEPSVQAPAVKLGLSTRVGVIAALASLCLLLGVFLVTRPSTSINPATDPLSQAKTRPQSAEERTALSPEQSAHARTPAEAAAAAAEPATTQPRQPEKPSLESQPPTPTPIQKPKTEDERIRDCLARAARAETHAFDTLDPTPLRAVYTGEALDAYEGRLRQLAASHTYERHTLHQQRITGVSLFDSGRARARLSEVWSLTQFQAKTGRCLAHFREYTVTQSALLRLEGDQWKIYVLNGSSPTPAPSACP